MNTDDKGLIRKILEAILHLKDAIDAKTDDLPEKSKETFLDKVKDKKDNKK